VKRTWVKRSIGDVDAVLASRLSHAEVARRLGVNKSTVSRWRKASKVSLANDTQVPTSGHLARRPVAPEVISANNVHSNESFLEWATATFNLSHEELELVRLAQQALDIARDPSVTETVRLQAGAQFARLRKDLKLPTTREGHGDVQAAEWPRAV
jgi:transposase-like protein